MKKKRSYLLITFLMVLYSTIGLKATTIQQGTEIASETAIVSVRTVEDDLFLFVRPSKGKMKDFSYQVGTTLCPDIKEQGITKMDEAMKTLVLVDNSSSISQQDRSKIKQLLIEMVAEKKDNELVRIATFDKQVHYMTDYISDYTTLKKAVQCITYQDQETYLTDVLYPILDNEFEDSEKVYHRILIISDGVDNKALGYTKEELYDQVKEKMIPIYTIGCAHGKNNEQLKSLFALSRQSAATYYVMNEVKDITVPVQEMAKDRTIIRLQVKPEAALMDGSSKRSMLTLTEGNNTLSLVAQVTMPFKVATEEPTPKVEESMAPEASVVEEEKTAEEVPEQEVLWFMIIEIVAAAVVLAGVVIFILLRRKKQHTFETMVEEGNIEEDFEEPTEITVEEDGELTNRIWDEPTKKNLVLTDLNTPSKSFQVPLLESVVIGRSHKQANLVIDYDKSVSATHCEIKIGPDNKIVVTDLQSSNGTFVNDSRVRGEVEISSGVTLKLGRLEFKLEIR